MVPLPATTSEPVALAPEAPVVPAAGAPLGQPSPALVELQSVNDGLRGRVEALEALVQPLLQKVEELVVSKLNLLDAALKSHRDETITMREELVNTQLELEQSKNRQYTLAEASVDMRLQVEELKTKVGDLLTPSGGQLPMNVSIATPPSRDCHSASIPLGWTSPTNDC